MYHKNVQHAFMFCGSRKLNVTITMGSAQVLRGTGLSGRCSALVEVFALLELSNCHVNLTDRLMESKIQQCTITFPQKSHIYSNCSYLHYESHIHKNVHVI